MTQAVEQMLSKSGLKPQNHQKKEEKEKNDII
jgi:hypothetical protein